MMKDRNVPIMTLIILTSLAAIIVYGCGRGVIEDEIVTPPGGPVISDLGPAWITVDTTSMDSDIVSLEVSWTTDVPSTTKLIYYFGSDESGTAYSTEVTTLSLTHEVKIIVGSPEFCYRALSKNAASKETISALDSPVLYIVMGTTTFDADKGYVSGPECSRAGLKLRQCANP